MGYQDANLVFAGTVTGNTVTGQTVTGNSPVNANYSIDLQSRRDLGEGEDLYLRIGITSAFAGLSACEFQLVAADDPAMTTNVTVVGTTSAIPVAQLVAGARFCAGWNPRIGSTGQRYLGARFIPTGTGTAGAVIADLGADISDGGKTYPIGFTIQ